MGLGRGVFCVIAECYCTVAIVGEAEFEFGDLRERCRMVRNTEGFFDALE